jgi:hypothetical protein
LKLDGEEYKIENWAQCDRCNQWRRVQKTVKGAFRCGEVGRVCNVREKVDASYITL